MVMIPNGAHEHSMLGILALLIKTLPIKTRYVLTSSSVVWLFFITAELKLKFVDHEICIQS